jgi:hypothetical protein
MLRAIALFLLWLVVTLLTVWATAALTIDVRHHALRIPLAILYVLIVAVIVWKAHGAAKPALVLIAFLVVLAWWFSLKPTNSADWQENVSHLAKVEINGDVVNIHNYRNCDYRSENDYSNCWSDRNFNLSQLRAVDIFLTNWGIPQIAHPIVSFDFGNNQHVAFSIEARYKIGQDYSTVLGFYRQFELIFVTAAESDVIRLRTNYRKGEEVSLYRTNISPEVARAIFRSYADYLDRLRSHPEWYNALTRNCTTTMDRQLSEAMPNPQPISFRRMLLNGTLDEYLYSRGRFVTNGLSFDALKQQAHINPVAQTVTDPAQYSAKIRQGRVGF